MPSLSTVYNVNPFSDVYPERPIWALYSSTTNVATGTLYTFGANPYINIGYELFGGTSLTNWKIRPTADEFQASNIYMAGNSTTAMGTNNWAPSSGFWGCSSFAQNACLANIEMFSNGYWGWRSGNTAAGRANYTGTMVGGRNFCQSFDLYNVNNVITIDKAGSSLAYQTDTTAVNNRITLSSLSGWASQASPQAQNIGMLSYNRTTNKIAVLVGTVGSATAYRLHVISLNGEKLSTNTTQANLSAMVATAVAAGSPSYKYTDVTFPTPTVQNSFESLYKLKLVLCDDDTLWIVRNDAASGGAGSNLRLYAISSPITNAGSVSLTQFASLSNGTNAVYTFDTDSYNGMRHMNSDDNSRIAFYVPYTSYNCGIRLISVNTASAATASDFMTYTDIDSTNGYSIAPCGGKRFVMTKSQNADNNGAWVYFLDTTTLNALNKGIGNAAVGFYPTPSAATMYGGAIVMKVLPMRDSK